MKPIFHVIKDPVHGTMQFTSPEDDWIKPFVDSANFQRLRHIKQLGLGDFIFPGAVHSRFNHSLGCCYVGSQIAHKIGLTDHERQLVMIACLLHDIGHGPFSHTFEGIFPNKSILHEDWTPYFLADYGKDDFFQRYHQRNPTHALDPTKFSEIANMIMKRPVKKRVLADIVSSQLDADRLDYLLRDSHFCGVRYGEFDFRWMLHCLTIVQTESDERLGITHKGIGVVEHYLMARRLMMRNIYHSQKKLAFENLLIALLAYLASSLDEVIFSAIKATRLGQFLKAAHQFNNAFQADSTSESKQKLKKNFLEAHFSDYRALWDYDLFVLIRQLVEIDLNHPAVLIAKRLHERIMPKILRLDHVDILKASNEIESFKRDQRASIADWQLTLVQTPHQSYSEGDPILVVNEQGQIDPIGEFSFMLNMISDKLEHSVFLSIDKEIFHHPHLQAFIKQFKVREVYDN